MAIVERFKQESMYGLSAKKSGRCGEMTVSGDSTVVPASFWRGNVIAYYEFKRECRSGGNKSSNVRSFIILRSEEGLTSFNKN